jgi:hypothetical protein
MRTSKLALLYADAKTAVSEQAAAKQQKQSGRKVGFGGICKVRPYYLPARFF